MRMARNGILAPGVILQPAFHSAGLKSQPWPFSPSPESSHHREQIPISKYRAFGILRGSSTSPIHVMKIIRTLCHGVSIALAGFFASAVGAQTNDAIFNETIEQRDARMAWFRDARFGMFIHWGVYAVPAGEWDGKTNYGEWFLQETKVPVSQYVKYADQFNPVKFDAKEWVRLAKAAGMKYIVITSKHHDGFGLWDSQLTDWDIARTPFKRDPLKELAAACKEAGIIFCFYYSIMDWHHPDWGTRRAWNDLATGTPDMDRYTAYMKGQLKELITDYGPLGILWFDGEWEAPWTHERGVDLYQFVRNLQPSLIVNNRVGKGRAGMSGMDQGQGVGDYGTPEQEIPPTGFGTGVDWESCMTMNNHWGYNKHDQNWKATETLVRNLIDCASKGGNYLLNIGPTAEGDFPAPSIERLQQIGQWMQGNSAAIYGTTASPFRRLTWGRATKKVAAGGTTLYLHVFNWPADGKLVVPGLKNEVKSARLLASGQTLTTRKTATDVEVTVPATAPDQISTTIVLELVGAPEVVAVLLGQQPDGSIRLPASEATLHGQLQYEHAGGRDNIGFWTDSKDWVEWEFRVTRPGKFNLSAEVATEAATKFEVEVAGQKMVGAAENTGGYSKFVSVHLGAVNLPGGEVTLRVRAVAAGWQPLNLKSVSLRAVQD
jgi:alpha-L-fucosidase